jgi:hypothetical protein
MSPNIQRLRLRSFLKLNAPAYLFKEAFQVIRGGYSASYFLGKIIEVKRIVKLILKALNGPRLLILPSVDK